MVSSGSFCICSSDEVKGLLAFRSQVAGEKPCQAFCTCFQSKLSMYWTACPVVILFNLASVFYGHTRFIFEVKRHLYKWESSFLLGK
jgi:hypothetical protein